MSGLVLSLLFLAVQVSAANVQNEPFSGEVGVYHNWTSGVQAVDNGVSIAGASQSSVGSGGCSSGVLMAQAGNMSRTDISIGHYVQSANVTLQNVALANSCFNVTVTFNNAVLTPLYVKTSSSPVLNDFAICKFDLGTAVVSGSYLVDVNVKLV